MSSSKIPQPLSDPRLENLARLIADLEEEETYAEIKKLLDDGLLPFALLDACMEGMRRVGIRFENREYYISGLIMGGEIMRIATELLSPHLVQSPVAKQIGKALVGTIEGDIHDLGKNLFHFLLTCHGIEVIDLGVDVPIETFLEKAKEIKPDIIGISCLMTTGIENLKAAVEVLRKKLPSPDVEIIVGGTCLDAHLAKYIGARYWAPDAADGLRICQDILSQKSS